MKSKSTMIDQMFSDHPNEIEPGTTILHIACPCCGAQLDIEAGDDVGSIAVIGTPKRILIPSLSREEELLAMRNGMPPSGRHG
jgi:hypothetical protein